MSRLVTTYRVLAYVTGVVLILLVFVAVPLKYLADKPEPTAVVGQLHGFLYLVYFVVALLLGFSRRWSFWRILRVVLAGTVPFAAFFAERRVAAEERASAGGDASGADQLTAPS
jgi:integral membrane protein